MWLILIGGYVDDHYSQGRYTRQVTGLVASLLHAFQR